MKIVIGIYSHPEFFPPTLNAIGVLSEHAEHITVVGRNQKETKWPYPDNVTVCLSGQILPPGTAEAQSAVNKIRSFFQFAKYLATVVRKEQPDILLVYDSLALYAVKWARRMGWLRTKCTLWYHCHDVAEPGASGKYSITYRAAINEKKYLNRVHFFSIPSEERLSFFPIDRFRGKYRVVPNYPSRNILSYVNWETLPIKDDGVIKLIYQGNISAQHGLEQIIPLLNKTIQHKTIQLTLAGSVTDDYRNALQQLAADSGTSDRLIFTGRLDYRNLFTVTAQQDIGLAIHLPQNIIYSTGGTASNKIYEYMGMGLPVVLYDNEHYRKHLGDKNWAFFTDLTPGSILKTLEKIISRYNDASKQASEDFKLKFNYETHFRLAMEYFNLVPPGKQTA